MNNNKQQQGRYSFSTALAMIVGIVIGSGIFFKSDDVLKHTGGNILLGVIVFILAAIAIIFGSLAIAELAKRSDSHGGVIAYADEFVSPHFATMIGWFQVFLYYPTLAAIVSWVVGIFVTILFAVPDASLELQIMIGLSWLVICYIFNIVSAIFAGRFQVFATVVKLIPLFVLGGMAFLYGQPAEVISNPTPQAVEATKSLAWLAAVGPIAFAFDGWIVATSISGELRNAKRNLPLALVTAPIIILIGYLIYFVGISSYIGPEQILVLGDKSVELAATKLFGETAGKAFLVFVIISVMGTVNGLIMGLMRLPYSLALTGSIPFSKQLSKVSPRFQLSLSSAGLGFVLALFWLAVHYITMKSKILGSMDISEIAVVVSYLLYIVLYFAVFRLWRKGEIRSAFFGLVVPIMATLGSLFILFGGMQNPLFLPFCLPVCFVVLGLAFVYSKKRHKQ